PRRSSPHAPTTRSGSPAGTRSASPGGRPVRSRAARGSCTTGSRRDVPPDLGGSYAEIRLADPALDEGDLEDLLVGDRAVAEVAVLAEQLAVVRRHDEPRALGDEVEETLEHAVEVGDGAHL